MANRSEVAEVTKASLSQVFRNYQTRTATIGEMLDELGGITFPLDSETLGNLHMVMSSASQGHLQDLIKELTRTPELDTPADDQECRQSYMRQWVASTLLAHGPDNYREKIIKTPGLLPNLLSYYDAEDYDEVQTSLVTKVLASLHTYNDGKVAEQMIECSSSMKSMIRHIQCDVIANFIPKLILGMRNSHKYPFDFEVVHKRSCYALLNANLYESLLNSFATSSNQAEYRLEHIRIMENSAYALGETAGRLSLLPQINKNEVGSLFAESARLFSKARVGLDVYLRPKTVESLLKFGLDQYKTREIDKYVAMECALDGLLYILKRYERGLHCRFGIVTALTATKTTPFIEMLSEFMPDFMTFLKDESEAGSLLRFRAADVLSTSLASFRSIARLINGAGFPHEIVRLALAPRGCFYEQMMIKSFQSALRTNKPEVIKPWLEEHGFMEKLVSSMGAAAMGEDANFQVAALSLKQYMVKLSLKGENDNTIRSYLGPTIAGQLDEVDADQLAKFVSSGLPVLYRGRHPKALLDTSQGDKIDTITETERESMFYYSAVKNVSEGMDTNSERFENVLGLPQFEFDSSKTFLTSIFGREVPPAPTKTVSNDSSGMDDRAARTVRSNMEDRPGKAKGGGFSMRRYESESNRGMEDRKDSNLPASRGNPFSMKRAGSESSRTALANFVGQKQTSDQKERRSPFSNFFRGLSSPKRTD
ncbi:hypothetical protein NDN08_008155 [Rhodosorus marinus]|uniref:Uncharacterized protein n=1 Tax=Rhodosorus marinus TaxID=101924 RepID=A0AAV8UZJ7_9RHOD|nr:hypothetical protein NDN08_008155 [Rhodosorus marinus]